MQRIPPGSIVKLLAGPALLVILGLSTQQEYVVVSVGNGLTNSGFTEVPGASTTKLVSELEEFRRLPYLSFLTDSWNLVASKIQAGALRPRPVFFPGFIAFREIMSGQKPGAMDALAFRFGTSVIPRETQKVAEMLNREQEKFYGVVRFDLRNSTGPFVNEVSRDLRFVIGAREETVGAILSTTRQSVFNRRSLEAPEFANFVVRPLSGLRNHLIFQFSSLGPSYFGTDRRNIALFQMEPDVWLEGSLFAGIGRHLMFEVVHPSPRGRLLFSMTSTFRGDGKNLLPRASYIGQTREALPLVGRGAARVLSPEVRPQVLLGHSYVALDLNESGIQFPERRSVLMNLYGRDIKRDNRFVVGFLREISMLSEEQVSNLEPPAALHFFPDDLLNPDLQFSGLFEDGWASEHFYAVLKRRRDQSRFRIRGMVPSIGGKPFQTSVKVLLDGRPLLGGTLGVGKFELVADVPDAEATQRVEVIGSAVQTLPDPDNRKTIFRLDDVGFIDRGPRNPHEDIVDPGAGVILRDGWGALSRKGGLARDTNGKARIQFASGRQPVRKLFVHAGAVSAAESVTIRLLGPDGAEFQARQLAGKTVIEVAPGRPFAYPDEIWIESVSALGRPVPVRVTRIHSEGGGPVDIVGPGIELVSNGGQIEHFNEESFRWIGSDLRFRVHGKLGRLPRVQMSIDPGPGIRRLPARFQLRAADGTSLSEFEVPGRKFITLDLALGTKDGDEFVLTHSGGGRKVPGDPRVLNYRILSMKLIR